ncbi:hypothetical protein MRX96_034944 [Rhipicephalus microplus]
MSTSLPAALPGAPSSSAPVADESKSSSKHPPQQPARFLPRPPNPKDILHDHEILLTLTSLPGPTRWHAKLLVSSSTVPPAAPPPATGASNGLLGASPHFTRTYPASSRPHSAPRSPPLSLSLFRATATVAPLPLAPQQAPASRPGVAQVVSASPSPRTSGASPRLIQPKQPQILPKLSSGSANMTTPSAAATTRSQSPPGGPAQGHTAARACTGAAACDHGAARSRDGAQHGESAAHREPRGSAAGYVSGWTCAGHFPAEPVHSGPGPQLDSDTRRIGADPELSGTDTGGPAGPAAIPCHGPDPGTSDGAQAPWGDIQDRLAPRRLSSHRTWGQGPTSFWHRHARCRPPSFAIVPGQPLTLQQLQAMLPTQTMLAQPTLVEASGPRSTAHITIKGLHHGPKLTLGDRKAQQKSERKLIKIRRVLKAS